jgi:hypothetical protein
METAEAQEAPVSPAAAQATPVERAGPRKRLLDALAIVASILLAFGIDAWWDARRERALEREYLSALSTEVQNALREVAADLDGQETLRAQLAYYVREANVPPDSLRRILSNAASVSNIAPPTSVIEDLVSSGRLQIIRSAEIREGIMLYRQMLEKIAVNERPHHDFVNNRFVPHLSQLMALGGILRTSESGALPVPSDGDLRNIQRDQNFRNLMIERLARLDRGLPRIRSTKRQLEKLQASLTRS